MCKVKLFHVGYVIVITVHHSRKGNLQMHTLEVFT